MMALRSSMQVEDTIEDTIGKCLCTLLFFCHKLFKALAIDSLWMLYLYFWLQEEDILEYTKWQVSFVYSLVTL